MAWRMAAAMTRWPPQFGWMLSLVRRTVLVLSEASTVLRMPALRPASMTATKGVYWSMNGTRSLSETIFKPSEYFLRVRL